jgi:hypothetical protein
VAEGLPSIGVLLTAVERRLDQQRSHFESLDTKAGVAVGFAGVIAALAKDVDPFVAKVGVGVAVVAAVLAMLSFRPRKHPIFDPLPLREHLQADERSTQLKLLDTQIEMSRQTDGLVKAKARLLQAALAVLVVSVVLLAVGTLTA